MVLVARLPNKNCRCLSSKRGAASEGLVCFEVEEVSIPEELFSNSSKLSRISFSTFSATTSTSLAKVTIVLAGMILFSPLLLTRVNSQAMVLPLSSSTRYSETLPIIFPFRVITRVSLIRIF